MNFDDAFARVIGHEGVLSLDPQDRGNWTSGIVGVGELRGTKYGVSAMSYPNVDIRSLTLEGAKTIFRRDFWDRVHGDELHDGVSFQLFDFAINSGIGNGIRGLQRAIGVAQDGQWGPISRAAALAMTECDTVMRLLGARLEFMTSLSSWPSQGKGWARRIARNLFFGAEDS